MSHEVTSYYLVTLAIVLLEIVPKLDIFQELHVSWLQELSTRSLWVQNMYFTASEGAQPLVRSML